MQKSILIRFYEELNDFLGPEKHKKEFKVSIQGVSSVKELIESIGVPHTEVDLILVNGSSVSFAYVPQDRDRVSVYPVFEIFDISEVSRLRKKPLRRPKFILDADLGELAKYLTIVGLDARYKNDSKPHEIVQQSVAEQRTILTRNPKLFSSKAVVRCYHVKQTGPQQQFNEIMDYFDLKSLIA